MIESRCGLKCSECKYREIMKCEGCLKIKKPYWGKTCPIKSCCESKGKENCGLCPKFPAKSFTNLLATPLWKAKEPASSNVRTGRQSSANPNGRFPVYALAQTGFFNTPIP